MKVQKLFRDAEVSPIKSPDLGMYVESSGGGDVSAVAIDAAREIGKLRDTMTKSSWVVLEKLCRDGGWLWEVFKDGRRRKRVYNNVRRSLDYAAVFYKLMGEEAFRMRWPNSRLRRAR